jgi:WD40 repeat protein
VTSVAFSPDGKLLASSGLDHTIRLWDVARLRDVAARQQRAVLRHPGHFEVWSVAFTPDGSSLVSVAGGGPALLWDVASGKVRAELFKGGGLVSVSVSPDGRRVAAASYFDRLVRLWDLEAGLELAPLKGHVEHVQRVAFSPDGRRLASSSDDGTVKLWDMDTLEEIFSFRVNNARVIPLAFSPNGKTLAAGASDNTVRYWSAADGAEDRPSPADAISPRQRYARHVTEAFNCLVGGLQAAADFHLKRFLGSPLPEEVLLAPPAFRRDLATYHTDVAARLEQAGRRQEAAEVRRRADRLSAGLGEAFPVRPR